MKITPAQKTAIKNFEKNAINTTVKHFPKYNIIKKENGLGALLHIIRWNPGISWEKVLEKHGVKSKSKYLTTQQALRWGGLIFNKYGEGYFITKLGKQLLEEKMQ